MMLEILTSCIPGFRRRNHAPAERERQSTAGASPHSPFFYYNSCFDPLAAIRRHAVAGLKPHPDYLTNYLGVLIDPMVYPPLLAGRQGTVEDAPVPSNWHADIAEWGAALRAVELAATNFTMIELGCGWGCWMNNTGAAARRLGLAPMLIGIESDAGHLAFAKQALAANGFSQAQYRLHQGIAAATTGTALFPRHADGGILWGRKPVFGADAATLATARTTGSHEELQMITLATLATGCPRIDLLHVDIQGGEADLIAGSLSLLHEKIAYLVIGTHSREIEGRLFETLLAAGWILEIDRPAILALGTSPTVTIDGVQAWRNPALVLGQH